VLSILAKSANNDRTTSSCDAIQKLNWRSKRELLANWSASGTGLIDAVVMASELIVLSGRHKLARGNHEGALVWLEMRGGESPLAMFSKSCFTKQIELAGP
jgi:hypothetical protein